MKSPSVVHRIGRASLRLPAGFIARPEARTRVRDVVIEELAPADPSDPTRDVERRWQARWRAIAASTTPYAREDRVFYELIDLAPGLRAFHYGHTNYPEHTVEVLWRQGVDLTWLRGTAAERESAVERVLQVWTAYRRTGFAARNGLAARGHFFTPLGAVAIEASQAFRDEDYQGTFQSRDGLTVTLAGSALEPFDAATTEESPLTRAALAVGALLAADEGTLERNRWVRAGGLEGHETAVVSRERLAMDWQYQAQRADDPPLLLDVSLEASGTGPPDRGAAERAWTELLCTLEVSR